ARALPQFLDERFAGEWSDPRPHHPLFHLDRHSDLSLSLTPALEQPVERDLEILELIVGQVEANCEPSEHEMGDAEELPLAGKAQADLVPAHVCSPPPCACSSSARSRSRRCAASLAASTAARQSRRARSVAVPWETPAARPDNFSTGLTIARLT